MLRQSIMQFRPPSMMNQNSLNYREILQKPYQLTLGSVILIFHFPDPLKCSLEILIKQQDFAKQNQ